MKRVVIKKAELKDVSQIENIYKKTYIDEYRTQYPKTNKKSILNRISNSKKRIQDFKKGTHGENWLLLIAKEENKIVGFGQAHVMSTDKLGGWIDKLYLLKEYRRKSIGKRLTQELIRWLKKKNVKEIQTKILIKNKASLVNFEKQGFEKFVYILRRKLK